MVCISRLSLLIIHLLHANLAFDNTSGDIVFLVHGSSRQAWQIAKDHNLVYISEVFPGSHLHHARLDPTIYSWQRREAMSLQSDPRVALIDLQLYQPRHLRYQSTIPTPPAGYLPSQHFTFNDPLYNRQWYLHGDNHGQRQRHINVVPVWKRGFTGRGVYVTVLDDNVNYRNPEVYPNYEPNISGDLGEHDQIDDRDLVHGTYCAAIIAAAANNSICGVGVAYNAKIGGVRLLVKKRILDVQEAKALNYKLNQVDIYSASWGPPDDGKHIGGPGKLALQALIRGVTLGRKGLGAIYVWASGNGGMHADHCGCDGYASSIYTLTVSALTAQGLAPYYSETCPSVLTSVYVGGHHRFPASLDDVHKQNLSPKVLVPEMDGQCRMGFQGTSAAAPLAAGVIALLLEANVNLTWRDVHHLVVLNSFPPNDAPGWVVNGAGLKSHRKYGFGALDAARLIEMGKNWNSVSKQLRNEILFTNEPRILETKAGAKFAVFVNASNENVPGYLEYVMITLTVDVIPRGALKVALQSPSGLISPLLSPRRYDDSTEGFLKWNLTTAQFWLENPSGEWYLHLFNYGNQEAVLRYCLITLFGY